MGQDIFEPSTQHGGGLEIPPAKDFGDDVTAAQSMVEVEPAGGAKAENDNATTKYILELDTDASA